MTYRVETHRVEKFSGPMSLWKRGGFVVAAAMFLPLIAPTSADAQSLGYAPQPQGSFWSQERALPVPQQMDDQVFSDEGDGAPIPDRLKRKVVEFDTREAPGTIVIDTANTYLYYVLGRGQAVRYGVGVGREGFTWSGVQTVSRKADWPDWHPPAEMIARQPYLPRFMAGGPGNPLGAAAMYLGSTTYRIHGTNDPSTIGKFVSSGCIRLTNEDVQELASRVTIGTKVVVLPKGSPLQATLTKPAAVNANAMIRHSPQAVKISGLY